MSEWDPKTTCFIIMPFSQTTDDHTTQFWTEHFEDFLKPTIEEVGGIKAVRSQPLRGNILESIIRHLVYDRVVVADITDYNPNVLWELGVRQSFKNGTLTIMEESTGKIPFDLSQKGILSYFPKNHVKNEAFCASLQKGIKECLAPKLAPDSVVLQTITGRGTVYQTVNREENMRRVVAFLATHTSNTRVLNTIYRTIESNKTATKSKRVNSRFTIAPAELLVTNRYLDRNDDFYATITEYMKWMRIMNDLMQNWVSRPITTLRWFNQREATLRASFKSAEEAVESAQVALQEAI